MIILALLSFFYLIYIDVKALRRESEGAFLQVMRPSLRILVYFFLLGIIIWLNDPSDISGVCKFFILFLTPYYIYKRHVWLKEIDSQHASYHQELRHTVKLQIEAVGVILHWTGWMIILTAFYAIVSAFWPQAIIGMTEVIISAVFSSAVLFGLIYRSSRHFSRRGFRFNVGLRKGKLSWLQALGWPVILGFMFAIISAWIMTSRDVQPQTPLGDILDETTSPSLLLIFLGLALLMAPLVEEITFRGYFFHVLKKIKGRKFATIIIALTFSLLHVNQYWGDWIAIMMVTVLGFCLTITRARMGNIVGSTAMHYVYNTGVTIIPVIMMMFMNFSYMRYQMEFGQLSFSEKEQLLHESMENRPRFADSYNDLAWLYATNDVKLQEANQLIDKALAIAPDNTAFLDTKAEVLTRLGEIDKALSLRQDILKRLKEDSDFYKEEQVAIEKLEHLKSNSLPIAP